MGWQVSVIVDEAGVSDLTRIELASQEALDQTAPVSYDE